MVAAEIAAAQRFARHRLNRLFWRSPDGASDDAPHGCRYPAPAGKQLVNHDCFSRSSSHACSSVRDRASPRSPSSGPRGSGGSGASRARPPVRGGARPRRVRSRSARGRRRAGAPAPRSRGSSGVAVVAIDEAWGASAAPDAGVAGQLGRLLGRPSPGRRSACLSGIPDGTRLVGTAFVAPCFVHQPREVVAWTPAEQEFRLRVVEPGRVVGRADLDRRQPA